MHNHLFKKTVPIILVAIFFMFMGCKKDKSPNKAITYDFSYSGSQYLGGTIHFSTSAPHSSTLLWNFGDSTGSTGFAPDHSYIHTGPFTVSLIINGDSTKIISKTVYIGADSIHQALTAGTWLWHKQTAGYDPLYMKDTIFHYNDTTLVVYSVEPGTILFNADTLFYASTNDSTINFHRTHYSDPKVVYSDYAWSNFTYSYLKNKILYTYEYHVSAGAGNWTNTYTSF